MRKLIVLMGVALVMTACGGVEGAEQTVTTADGSVASTAATTVPPTTTTTEAMVPAPELAGTSWNVTDYRLPDGAITNVWKTEVTISFAADGTFSGSAGCNTYSGTWAVSGSWNEFEDGVRDAEDGQELMLTGLAWTEIGCEDAAIMEQETEFLGLLQRGARWVLIRGDFHLRDAEGSYLFEAEPA